MSRVYINVDGPKYESQLPAFCHVKWPNGEDGTAVLWESYIDHRTSSAVYLCSVGGRTFMLPEDYIIADTVMHMPIARKENPNGND